MDVEIDPDSVVLFCKPDHVTVWSIGLKLRVVQECLATVRPGGNYEGISFETLQHVGRGEHTLEELRDEEGLRITQRANEEMLDDDPEGEVLLQYCVWPEEITIWGRAESENPKIVGHIHHTIKPGDVFFGGVKYETIQRLGSGAYRVSELLEAQRRFEAEQG